MKSKTSVSTLLSKNHKISVRANISTPDRDISTTVAKQPRIQTGPTRRPNRIAGLDALRAIAVLLVIAYHFFPQAVAGGFIGVDIFFVISGFLITTLLLREHRIKNRISLKNFWRRRARRLLPALVIMVLVTTALAGLIGQDADVGLRSQVLGAATFSSNWVYIAQGTSYAASLTPALFANLWSLAVEEQFYLLWPLLVLGGLTLSAKYQKINPRMLALITGALVVASALAMALIYDPQVDPSRVYFGTDTHLFGIMLGAFLAMIRRPNLAGRWPSLVPGTTPVLKARNRLVTGALGLVSAIVLLSSAFGLSFTSAFTYRGGLMIVALATAGLIAAILSSQNFAAKIEIPILQWVGQRSYGIYLWHWPLLILASYLLQNRDVGSNVSAATAIAAGGILVVAAWASYKYVELPIMHAGFRKYARRIKGKIVSAQETGRAAVSRVAALSTVVVLSLVFAAAGLLASPQQSSIERDIAAGAAQIEPDEHWGQRIAHAQAALAQKNLAAEADRITNEEAAKAPEPPAEKPAEKPQPKPKPAAPAGDQVTIIGDSVTLASVPGLKKALPGIAVNAETSRGVREAPQIMKELAAKDKLRPYVVIALATNAVVTQKDIDAVVAEAGDRPVIFVTGHGQRSWITQANKAIKKAAKENPQVTLADWDKVIKDHPGELARDGIHPGEKAGARFAKEIVRALTQASENTGA